MYYTTLEQLQDESKDTAVYRELIGYNVSSTYSRILHEFCYNYASHLFFVIGEMVIDNSNTLSTWQVLKCSECKGVKIGTLISVQDKYNDDVNQSNGSFLRVY
jgi:hypothetical protein